MLGNSHVRFLGGVSYPVSPFMKTLQLSILLSLIGLIPIKAQDLGYINDPDGYANLRLEPSGKSDIIGIITSDQVFRYYPDNSDWWKVDFYFRTGYLHKSMIKNFDKIKSEIINYFQDYYSADRNNVELSEAYNEKLFMVTQNYPLATLTAFCEQSNEIQEFIISVYKSPLHDLINLQLIYSRLISSSYSCKEAFQIINAIDIAAKNIGQDLKNIKNFTTIVPEDNKPVKHLELTNNWFVSELNGKPITFYLNHPEIDTYSKMFYQGQFALSDDTLTFAFLDSVLTTNQETQSFYLHVFNYAVKVADGALAEVMGSYCKPYFEKNTCRFIDLKTDEQYSDYYQKWIDFIAFEYYFEEKPYEAIDNAVNTIRPSVVIYCSDKKEELENIRLQLIDFVKKNED